MTTKELIARTIDNLDDAYLEELYLLVQNFARTKKQEPTFDGMDDSKDMLMNDLEALRILYKEAEEEDRQLAQTGIEHYVDLLKHEEESFA